MFSPWVSAMLAESLYRQGRYEEAKAVLPDQDVLSVEDRALTLAKRAKILAKAGDVGEARRLAEQAMSTLPAGGKPDFVWTC